MPTNRKRVGRTGAGIVTERAVQLYREGVAMPARTHAQQQARWDKCRQLHTELRLDSLLPWLLDDEPRFLFAVPDETPYRATWAELKAELDAAVQS